MKQCRFDGRFAVLFSNSLDDLERECGLAINDLEQIARYQARYQERLGQLLSLLAGGSR